MVVWIRIMQSLYLKVLLTSCLVTVFAFYDLGRQLRMLQMKFYRPESIAFVGNWTLIKRIKENFDCCFLYLESGPSSARLSLDSGGNNKSRYRSCELINSERYMKPDKLHEHQSYDCDGTATTVSRN